MRRPWGVARRAAGKTGSYCSIEAQPDRAWQRRGQHAASPRPKAPYALFGLAEGGAVGNLEKRLLGLAVYQKQMKRASQR